MSVIPSREGATPYIPQYRSELKFAGRIHAAKVADRVGLVAIYGGIFVAICGIAMQVSFQLPLEALAAYIVGALAVITGVVLTLLSFTLHVVASIQAFSIRRMFPHNPLPAKYLHSEFVRWIHRIDLILTVAATILVTFASFGIGIGITVPSGLGLGVVGWAVTEIWGYGTNRAVNKEVARQRRLAKVMLNDPRYRGSPRRR